MKVLVFATDVTPIPGLPTSGTALRTFGMIQGLLSHGHEVITSVPKSALEGLKRSIVAAELSEATKSALLELEAFAFDARNQSSILAQVRPDAVLCGHWPAMTLPTKPSQAVILDLAGPHMLERHYQGSPNQLGAMLAKLGVLGRADYFIVSGQKQRLYFMAYLQRAQVERPEQRMITIPMPLSPNVPEHKVSDEATYPHFVFGGVFLPWQDPTTALNAVASRLETSKRGQLTLIGGKHPNYKIREGVYSDLFARLSQNPQVVAKPMLPYEEFVANLGEMDVAVDLMKWNLERELAVTIRSTTYLWAGVPVIYNDYADIARHIRSYDAGWTISPDDPSALAGVMDEIYASPETVRRKSANASRLARELFSWDKAVQPLLDILGTSSGQRFRETDIFYDFPDNANYPVYNGKNIEQYFVCRVGGLSRVECRLATHNRTLAEPLTLTLFELENAAGGSSTLSRGSAKVIARETVQPKDVQNNEWCALDTAPIAHSAGKTFLFTLEAAEPSAATSLSPWAVRGSPYPLLGMYYGDERIPHASLCLRTTCAGSQ